MVPTIMPEASKISSNREKHDIIVSKNIDTRKHPNNHKQLNGKNQRTTKLKKKSKEKHIWTLNFHLAISV